MTEQQAIRFKEEMKRYRYLLNRTKELTDRIDNLLYEMTGVKGIAFNIIKGTTNEYDKAIKRHELSEEYDRLLNEVQHKTDRINHIRYILNQMDSDDKDLFLMKYYERISYENLGAMNGISKSGIIYHMDKILMRCKYEE